MYQLRNIIFFSLLNCLNVCTINTIIVSGGQLVTILRNGREGREALLMGCENRELHNNCETRERHTGW
jgi:hypothetical protein